MKKSTLSDDQTEIFYELSGQGETALLFAHGWLGNKQWWNNQKEYFSDKYLIAQLDLAGHGESGKTRQTWSSTTYADDIVAVARELPTKNVIVIGHSMSGVYATEAAIRIPNAKALILVDTLKNLDQQMTLDQTTQLHDLYLKDFKFAIENVIPQYLFVETTPPEVKAQLQKEFISHGGELAVKYIEPLYKTDVRPFAEKVTIPVRAINSDVGVTAKDINKKYFKDYDFSIVKGVGHYPMLENPGEFNLALEKILQKL